MSKVGNLVVKKEGDQSGKLVACQPEGEASSSLEFTSLSNQINNLLAKNFPGLIGMNREEFISRCWELGNKNPQCLLVPAVPINLLGAIPGIRMSKIINEKRLREKPGHDHQKPKIYGLVGISHGLVGQPLNGQKTPLTLTEVSVALINLPNESRPSKTVYFGAGGSCNGGIVLSPVIKLVKHTILIDCCVESTDRIPELVWFYNEGYVA